MIWSLCLLHVPNCLCQRTILITYCTHPLHAKSSFVFGIFCSCSSLSTLLPLPVLLFFQQRKWKSSKEVVVGLHTCRKSRPGSHHLASSLLLLLLLLLLVPEKSNICSQIHQDSNVCSFNTVMIQIRSGFA